jgi:hypothetical protein
VFCLVLTRYAFKRDVVQAEIVRAMECRLPVMVVVEKRASKTSGPKEFRKLVEQLLGDPATRSVVWDPSDTSRTVAKELMAFKAQCIMDDGRGTSHAAIWDFYISHTSHRKSQATASGLGAESLSLRGAVAFLVASVKDGDSVTALTALIEAQCAEGALGQLDGDAFLDILTRKMELLEGGGGGGGGGVASTT